MAEEEEETEGDQVAESAKIDYRDTDIEDQGQTVETQGEIDPDVESVEADGSEPGPKGEGAQEATRTGGDPPAESADNKEADSEDV